MKFRALAYWPIIVLSIFVLWLLSAIHSLDTSQAESSDYGILSELPQPYLEYQLYGGSVITDATMPPVLANSRADYAEIYEEHNLCALIASGQVDEVWIWAGNGDGITKGHMWEWTTSGPEWNGDAPDCGKVVTTMAFNYLREVDVALESFNHRLEGLFSHYFTCDFSTATWPWAGSSTLPFSQCGSLLSDRYGFVARPFAVNNLVGGCGDAHHPPNVLSNQDYIYNDTTTVQTICPAWSEDGSAVPTSLNCQSWGCTHWGFHLWWMQNVPGLDNINKDRNGNPQPNWWAYLFGQPTKREQIYMPVILSPNLGSAPITTQPLPSFTVLSNSDFVTEFGQSDMLQIDRQVLSRIVAMHSPTPLAAQPAVTTKKVYVLYYPGYGGIPRADVTVLTTELIGLMKEATIYHGYQFSAFRGTFFGQDGMSYAGSDCAAGTVPDNIHIRLDGLKSDVQAEGYRVEDTAGGGTWATPCHPASNWLLHVISASPGQADLYFKPFRSAPDGTMYLVTVDYVDGTTQSVVVIGTQVQP